MDKEQIKTQSNGDIGEFYIEIMLLLNNCYSVIKRIVKSILAEKSLNIVRLNNSDFVLINLIDCEKNIQKYVVLNILNQIF